MQLRFFSIFLLITMLLVSATSPCIAADGSPHPSPRDLVASPDGKLLYVAEATANRIAVFNLTKKTVTDRIALSGPPSGLALTDSGSTLYVTLALPQGAVAVVDIAARRVTQTIDVGHTPMSPVLSPDEKTLYVCNRFNNDISVIDLRKGKDLARINVKREPVTMVITEDGNHLLVGNHLPAGRADGPFSACVVSVINVARQNVSKELVLPNGSMAIRGMCASPDGNTIYLSHILAHYQLPTTQLDRGWMNSNAFSVLDAKKLTYINTVLLDDVSLGAANPWAVACSPDNMHLCVTHAGTHEVSVIDQAALLKKLTTAAGKTGAGSAKTVVTDMSFLSDIRQRRQLKGNGPRAIVVVDNQACVAEYYSDSLGFIDLTERTAPATSIPLAHDIKTGIVRKGERIFNDATQCFQLWQSCASCHPDARTDALNWDLLNDGMGNPKQDRSLVWSHRTPPVMISGIRDTAETAVRAGFHFIQFTVPSDDVTKAVNAYLSSLEPLPSPHLVNGKLSARAQRGKQVFAKADCIACHPPPLFTDLNAYDVGTGMEKGKAWDTPTLVENWRTAPYLYDGRAVTILDIFTKHDPKKQHGNTSDLSKQDMEDLAEYVKSL